MSKNKIIAIILVLLVIDFTRLLAVGFISSAMTRPERHIVVTDGGGGVPIDTPTETPKEEPSWWTNSKMAPTPEVAPTLEVALGLTSDISTTYPESIQQWGIWITRYANQYSIDPDLVAAIMVQESGGNNTATSSAGAQGLMQVMPFHACSTYEPEANIACGVHLLAIFRQKAPDWRSALAAYNAGEKGRDDGKGWGYADKVLAIYERNNQ